MQAVSGLVRSGSSKTHTARSDQERSGTRDPRTHGVPELLRGRSARTYFPSTNAAKQHVT